MIDSNILKINKILALNVSRETLSELEAYSNAIISRNKSINLISKSTEKIINNRHIEDSAQTIDFIDKNDIRICTDLGSGAGLPGIVLGILMKSKKPLFKTIFYEKSYHKANFLKEMKKKFNLNSVIHRKKIFKYIILFLGKSGKIILDDASKEWKFDYEEKKSLTNSESMIVKISNLKKKDKK